MFEPKRTIVYIQENKIKATQIILGKTLKIIKSSEYYWKEQDLDQIFKLIKKSFGKNVRFLIAEDKSYLAVFPLPLGVKDIRSKVSEKIEETFPLSLDQIVFDWKELTIAAEERVIQVFALPRQFLQNLSSASHKAGLHIQAFEPVSYSLARLTEEQEEAHLILATNRQTLAVAAFNGSVLMSTMVENFLTIKEMVNFVKEKFNLKIKKAVVSGQLKEDLKIILSSLKIEVVQQVLNPMFSLALKSDLKGKDAQVLNLEPLLIKKKAKPVHLPLDKKR